jgi:hypothetical protein
MPDEGRVVNQGIVVKGRGSFEAKNVVVGRHGQITDSSRQGGAAPPVEISELLVRFSQLISELPKEQRVTREALQQLSENLGQLVEKDKPNRTLCKITAKGLVEASKAVKSIAPNVLTTAGQIFQFITSL